MRPLSILILAAGLSCAAASGASAGWGDQPNPSHALNQLARQNAGAPLPVAGAGLPLLAAAGVYYAIRRRRRG